MRPVEHRPKAFSYHDKRVALQEALKLGKTAIFVDADTAIWFGADRRAVRKALSYEFPPGLHAGKLSPEDIYSFPDIEKLGRDWGLKFNRNVISYWEGLFALTQHAAVGQFFAIWDRFAEEARQRGYNGAGEGACFGIAAESCGLPRHYTTHMMLSTPSLSLLAHAAGLQQTQTATFEIWPQRGAVGQSQPSPALLGALISSVANS